mgnify:CR=1 FL=1
MRFGYASVVVKSTIEAPKSCKKIDLMLQDMVPEEGIGFILQFPQNRGVDVVNAPVPGDDGFVPGAA